MKMHLCIKRFVATLALAIVAALIVSGCASTEKEGKGEERISLAQMSGPARATAERETAGGRIESIVREIEKGKVVYDVEATVGGKHVEFAIADVDGSVLGTETQIEFAELPGPVKAEAEKFFGTTTGLTVMKGVESGKTTFEIAGNKGGKKVEVTFDPTGRRIE
ncbi:MAG: PepSY domain-containing protein [Verrucomicrobiia bacterium]